MHGLAAAAAQAEKYEPQPGGLMPKAIAGRGRLSIPRIKSLSSKAA